MGMTALHYASIFGHADVASWLIDHGATANRTNYDGQQPIHLAFLGAKEDVATLLIEKGAALNAADSKGNTPLHYAAESIHQPNMIASLIDKVAYPSIVNNTKSTPLHVAVQYANVEAALVMVEKAPSTLSQPNQLGQTPLHLALNAQNPDMVKLLLDHGANPNLEDFNGTTSYELAENLGIADWLNAPIKNALSENIPFDEVITPESQVFLVDQNMNAPTFHHFNSSAVLEGFEAPVQSSDGLS